MRHAIVLSLSLLVILCPLACAGATQEAGTSASDVSTEEYAVYEAVLHDGQRIFKETSAGIASTFDTERENLMKNAPSLKKTTVDDYERKNRKNYPLSSSFKLKVTLVGEDGFRQGRNNGVTSLSRVGVDQERNQALVHLTYRCSPACADDGYYLLAKDGNVWKVSKTIHLRIWN